MTLKIIFGYISEISSIEIIASFIIGDEIAFNQYHHDI